MSDKKEIEKSLVDFASGAHWVSKRQLMEYTGWGRNRVGRFLLGLASVEGFYFVKDVALKLWMLQLESLGGDDNV